MKSLLWRTRCLGLGAVGLVLAVPGLVVDELTGGRTRLAQPGAVVIFDAYLDWRFGPVQDRSAGPGGRVRVKDLIDVTDDSPH